MSNKIYGKIINEGIAIGRIVFKTKNASLLHIFSSTAEELNKLKKSKSTAIKNINTMLSSLDLSQDEFDIYSIQLELLEDEELENEIINYINNNYSLYDAILKVKNDYYNMFKNLDNETFGCRFDDIESVLNLLCDSILDNTTLIHENDKIVLYGEKIYPLDILNYRNNIVACISKSGSALSHTGILCKSIGIPYITNIDLSNEHTEQQIMVNANDGFILFANDTDLSNLSNQATPIKNIFIEPNLTVSASVSDKKEIISKDYQIGLCRTEFLFMKFNHAPTYTEQVEMYKELSSLIDHKPLTIRTLDICSDKTLNYLKLNKKIDNNYRSIQISFDNIELFKTQIKAILTSNTYNNISILFPFINSATDIKKTIKILNQCKQELIKEKITFNNVKIGAMIETPQAVENSYNIAKVVDFISIGTNDLTHYLYNIDRECDNIEDISLLLENVKKVTKNSHILNKKVCICGEIASDRNLVKFFNENNIDEIVVPYSKISLYTNKK